MNEDEDEDHSGLSVTVIPKTPPPALVLSDLRATSIATRAFHFVITLVI